MSDASLSRRLAEEPDFALGRLTVSPSTGRVIAGGEETRVEALSMAVLVTLAQAGGATVTRDALVEACWQGRIVSDDAVGRAIAKVRALERCATPAPFTIETVPKIGYRLLSDAKKDAPAMTAPKTRTGWAWRSPSRGMLAGGAIAATVVVVVTAVATAPRLPAHASAGLTAVEDDGAGRAIRTEDVSDALLVLDEQRLRVYLRRGWNPNWKLDSEGNAALHNLMMVCERHPTHDQAGLVRVARLLVEAGADPTARNKWSDTPLSIAATPRYCGPSHPVVVYLKTAITDRAARGAPTS